SSLTAHPVSMPTVNDLHRSFNHHVYTLADNAIAEYLYNKYNNNQLRILPTGGSDDNLVVHYLARRDADQTHYVVNVCQGIPGSHGKPGIANDTYLFGQGVHIGGTERTSANEIRSVVRMPIYNPDGSYYTGCSTAGYHCGITFLYVKIRGRYGWIAK